MSSVFSQMTYRVEQISFLSEKPHCHNYNSSVLINQEAYFDCSVNFRGNQPAKLSWRHGNKALNFSVDFENDTYALARMSMVATEEDDGNVYICHVTFPGVHNGFICQTLPKLTVYCMSALIYKLDIIIQ